MTLKKLASALSFAHLTGFAKSESPEDDKKAKGEGDDPKDQDHEDGNVKKGKKAEDEKDKPGAENGEPDEGDEKDKKAKGAKAEDDEDAEEDDKDEEMRGKSAAASARRRERARCAAIFASKSAGKNPALAANLAFNTSMTRKEALVVLESTPAPASASNDRAARNPSIGAGGAMQTSSRQAVNESLDRAFAKVAPRR